MNVSLIKSEKEHTRALKRFEALFNSLEGTEESDEFDLLSLVLEDYESKMFPIEAPDPIEAIKVRMMDLNLKQVDLVKYMGSSSVVSEVMNKKRKLTLDMIRKLTDLHLTVGILTTDYQLA